MSARLSEEEEIKNILAETLRITFKEILKLEMHDLETRFNEIKCEVVKLGALEKRVVELEKIIILNNLSLN